ncbi:hypothetical protein AB0E62_06355 [Streptomyces sp. NPDC038707]|uniref:hypothetical protein n=1 Tax=unclassified Streptomyces TaxID=2593676 RepID=UPI00340DA2BB
MRAFQMTRPVALGIAAVALAGAALAVVLTTQDGEATSDGPHYGAMPCSEYLASDDTAMRREAARELLQAERNNDHDSSGETVAKPASTEIVTEFAAELADGCKRETPAPDPWLTTVASAIFSANRAYFVL